MNTNRVFLGAAALALVVLLLSGHSIRAGTLVLGMEEIRDPMMNNAVAARVVLPEGWSLKGKEINWNVYLYGDPAYLMYGLEGPADEVDFSAISRLKFNFDQSWLATLDFACNEATRLANEQCQMAWRYTPAFAQQMCAQINASLQPELQKMRERKEALLSGQMMENGITVRQPMWAADIAEWLLRESKEISSFQIKKVEQPADLMALLRKAVGEQDAEMRRMSAQLGLPFKSVTFDVARVHSSFIKDGKPHDGITLVITKYVTLINNQRMPMLPGQSGPDPMYGKEYVLWEAHINAATALAGKLRAHDAELTVIAANSGVDPMWQAAVDEFSSEITRRIAEARQRNQLEQFQSQMAHQQKMQDMRNETFTYVNQRRQEVFARRSESLSNAATGWTDVFTDRQRWQGVGTKYVAPNNYKYAWEGADNKVVFSNDSSFDPNYSSAFSGNWNAMREVSW